MLHTELMKLDITGLKREMAKRDAELDDTIANLEQLPLNGTQAQNAQAAELTMKMQSQQETVSQLRARLLELEPPLQPAVFV